MNGSTTSPACEVGAKLEPQQPTILTADAGTITFPQHHPHWCDADGHLQYVLDSEGQLDSFAATAHFVSGGEAVLPELRTSRAAGNRITRDGGGEWWIECRQELQDPSSPHSGNASPPLIQLLVRDRDLGDQHAATISMTTGEARVLLHHLTRLVDHVDGGVS